LSLSPLPYPQHALDDRRVQRAFAAQENAVRHGRIALDSDGEGSALKLKAQGPGGGVGGKREGGEQGLPEPGEDGYGQALGGIRWDPSEQP
jgi:hypothetical protein